MKLVSIRDQARACADRIVAMRSDIDREGLLPILVDALTRCTTQSYALGVSNARAYQLLATGKPNAPTAGRSPAA